MSLDPVLGATARGALALLFLGAAQSKLRDRDGFRAALAGYRLLPEHAVGAAALLLAGAELAVGVALLVPGAGRGAAVGAGALLALYAAAIAANLRRGRRDIDCGCGGAASARPLGEDLVARNAVLLAVAVAAALPATARALMWLDAVSVAAGVAACALLYAAADRALANVARSARWRQASWSTR